MVSKCANPECGKRFIYFRGGRLFTLERTEPGHEHTEVEWFWLCEACVLRVDILVSLAKQRGAQIRRSPQAVVLERLAG